MKGVVVSQILVSDLDAALKTLNRMPDCYHKVMAFQRIATARGKAGDRVAARSAMERAFGIAQQMQDARSKAAALALLARGEAGIGDAKAARDTAAKAFQAACQIDYGVRQLAEVAKVQTLIGDMSAAQKTLQEASRRANEIVDAGDKSFEVCLIAKTQIAVGFPKEARETVRERLLPLLPLSEPWPDGYEDAAVLLAAAGDLAGGYETAKESNRRCQFPSVRNAKGCCTPHAGQRSWRGAASCRQGKRSGATRQYISRDCLRAHEDSRHRGPEFAGRRVY